jgi:hypothetical protein
LCRSSTAHTRSVAVSRLHPGSDGAGDGARHLVDHVRGPEGPKHSARLR